MNAKLAAPRTGRRVLCWLADWQVIPAGILAVVLMLADRLPKTVVALAVLAILPIWWLPRIARGRFFARTPADIPLLILLATLPVGYWASALPDLSVPILIQYLIAVTLFYSLVNSLTTSRKVELSGWALLAGTALLTGLSLVGTAWGGGKFLPPDLARRVPHLIGGFWYSAGFHPNIVGGALAVLVPVTAAYAWLTRPWPLRLLLWLLLAAEIVTLALTQARGAVLGFAIAMLVVAIGRDRRWAWSIPILVIAVAVAVALYGGQPALELVMGGFGDGTIRSAEGRLEIFSRGLYMLQDFPFTGVGLGMFPRVLPILYPLFLVGPDADMPHVHNIYLQMGIDHGFPGLIAFLALIILLWVMGMQAIRLSRGQPWEPLTIGLLAGLAAYLVHGWVDAIWHTPRSHIIIWGYLGLLAAVWRWVKTHSTATIDR